jgi:myo-inositol-1(or 4)-monophosphatase
MNPERILEGTRLAALEAGEVLLSLFGRLESVRKKGEGPGSIDLVTEADVASEKLLVERLRTLLPEASLLTEEGTGRDAAGGLRWVVDPLDGTTNFAHGYPVFSVSIALEEDGTVLLGVVHDPTRGETFTALRGKGAARNGDRLAVADARELGDAMLVTGFPYDVHTTRRDNLTQFAALLKRARAVRRGGSAALDLANVAAGRLDGFWEESLAPWDMAAGALLVQEAGGEVTGYRGEPFDLSAGHVVAANPAIHERLVAVLSEIEAGGDLPPLESRRRG